MDNKPELTSPGESQAEAGAGENRSVLMARINLSSRQRWVDWFHWLKKRKIRWKHIPTPGAETMVMPVNVVPGVQEYKACVVELTGLDSDLVELDRFRHDHTLLETWKPMARPVPQQAPGRSPKAALEAAIRRRQRALVRRGNEAAGPGFRSERK